MTNIGGKVDSKSVYFTKTMHMLCFFNKYMVADRLLVDSDFSLYDAIQLSYDVKANYLRGTSYKRYAPAFAERLGLRVEMTNDPEALRHCLRTGGAAVLHIGGDYEGYVGVFSHGGHYVAAISEEPDGRIAILDPSYKVGKYEEEGRKGKVEVKDKVGCCCVLYLRK